MFGSRERAAMSAVALLAAGAVGAGAAGVAALVPTADRRLAPRVRPYAVVARSRARSPARAGARRADTVARRPRRCRGCSVRRCAPLVARIEPHDRVARRRAARAVAPAGRHRRRDARPVPRAPGGRARASAPRSRRRSSRCSLRTPLVALARRGRRVRVRRDARAAPPRASDRRAGGADPARAVHRQPSARDARAHRRRARCRPCSASSTAGTGAVVDELAEVLTWTRSGMGEAEAFRRAAELTPEPSAARTYQLLAAGVGAGCRSRRRACSR